MRRIVDGCYLLAASVLAPVVAYRACRTGKYRADWDQRRGLLPELQATGRRVWVHAVSVGEVNAARGVVEAWREEDPTVEFVISTTTDTGLARARQVFPDLQVIRYPLDFSWFVARALDRIKPNLIVLVELEVWYQFVTTAADRGIPVAVINGRLSQRSVQRFGMVRPVVRRMFERLAWVGAQDGVYGERFRYMGVPADRVGVTGSVKWDGADVADTLPGADVLARSMGLRPDRPMWVAGSTGPGEEAVILEAFKQLRGRHPELQLVIVPRKPERFDEVADLIGKAGFECVRRSQSPDNGGRDFGELPSAGSGPEPVEGSRAASCPPSSEVPRPGDRLARQGMEGKAGGTPTPQDTAGKMPTPRDTAGKMPAPQETVFLGDTMGELRKFYCMASAVFVGRSLAAMGGSDAMEVAALAKPIVVGPHNENFADIVSQLQRGRAIRILSADLNDRRAAQELAEAIENLLADPAEAQAMGRRGREVVLANRGATRRTLDVLKEMLNRAQRRPA